jgi:hypothetical protein
MVGGRWRIAPFLVLGLLTILTSSTAAQGPTTAEPALLAPPLESAPPTSVLTTPISSLVPSVSTETAADPGVIQAGCPGCGGGGGGLLGLPPIDGPVEGGCACGCGANPPCLGQKPCYPCDCDNFLKRFCCCLYHCICCEDPCYEGRWIPIADAAFFVDSARPQTQQRLRWDHETALELLDRNTYFWAQANGTGRGPQPPLPFGFIEPSLKTNDELSMYTEIAAARVSFFVNVPYRSYAPSIEPATTPTLQHRAGFSDMSVGTKSLLFDCELMQITFEFTTYLPVGNPVYGLGTGHVTLEPTLLFDLKIGPETYLESQLAEWVPLGGDPGYQGSILESHVSLNQTLCHFVPNVPIIGTLEASTWSFQTGAYTDPTRGPFQHSGGYTYVYAGPGLRTFVCDKIDFGVGTHFALTKQHLDESLLRFEFRWRF